MPKSASTGAPKVVTRMLLGLTSRCTSPARCADSSALAILTPIVEHFLDGDALDPVALRQRPGAELHHDVGPAVGRDARLIDGDDRRVRRQVRQHVGLGVEHAPQVGVAHVARQHLDRDVAPGHVLLVEEHVGEAARAERPDVGQAGQDRGRGRQASGHRSLPGVVPAQIRRGARRRARGEQSNCKPAHANKTAGERSLGGCGCRPGDTGSGAIRARWLVRVERGIQRSGELFEHRLDLRLDVLADRGLDAQAVVEQDRAHLAADHVRVVVGEPDLLAERRLRLVAQRGQGRDVGIRLFGQPRDREQERRARLRIGVERQALELGLEPLGRSIAAGAVAGGLMIELGLQHRAG